MPRVQVPLRSPCTMLPQGEHWSGLLEEVMETVCPEILRTSDMSTCEDAPCIADTTAVQESTRDHLPAQSEHA